MNCKINAPPVEADPEIQLQYAMRVAAEQPCHAKCGLWRVTTPTGAMVLSCPDLHAEVLTTYPQGTVIEAIASKKVDMVGGASSKDLSHPSVAKHSILGEAWGRQLLRPSNSCIFLFQIVVEFHRLREINGTEVEQYGPEREWQSLRGTDHACGHSITHHELFGHPTTENQKCDHVFRAARLSVLQTLEAKVWKI